DDPSGISTYGIAGASTGYSMLWVILLTTPMMSVIQGMCARIAMVSGVGLAKAMRRRFPRWIVAPLAIAVIVANTINAGADLEGMSAAAQLLFGKPNLLWIALFGSILIVMQVYLSFHRFASVVKWLTLALFAYIVTAFVVRPPWGTVFRHLVLPEIHLHAIWLSTLVAVLGTTITPYLFFWQAALEVEEEEQEGRLTEEQRRGATREEIDDMHIDVNFGMIFSNLVAFFIIVTTAATLGAHGFHQITTAQDAARALEPLAGRFASWLFTAGMIGTGLLAIPAFTGSSAYILSDAFGFREGLNEKPSKAPQFYAILILGMLVAMAIGFLQIDPISALFWSAVINGVVAVPLLAAIVFLASDRRVMGRWVSSALARAWGWGTVVAMGVAAIAMFVFWGKA
ncbi:MAG TPA: divalent metal cation transporter, partial [Candidatus Acidoferrales bacterium]|nr:divalent metal cation transporter [Candidatus Acidoferrales bacterium]